MSELIECQQSLLVLANNKGYLTFDDILEAADTSLLSLSDIDRLSNNLQSLGVLIYETEPAQTDDTPDAYFDYSRTDYSAVFAEIISLSDTISPLIDALENIPPPQYGEVHTLVEQLQYGNSFAKERLILSHLRKALKIALSISKQYNYNIEDAVSASFIGLLEAIDHFDPNGFSTFQSYAAIWIQQSIHRCCNPIWMEYYCPTHIKEKIYPILLRYNNGNGTIIADDSYNPEVICGIAEEFDLSPSKVEQVLQFAYTQLFGHFELDVFSDPSEQSNNWGQSSGSLDNIISNDTSPFEIVAEKALKEALAQLLESFSPRECEIIRLRFGLDSAPKTLEEVGQIFDITRERVRQIENKCIRKLRHTSNAKKIIDFYC